MTTAPPQPTPHADVQRVLAVIAAVASIALTGVAFWLSYAHLHAVADAHGLKGDTVRAWAWPATVDLFIVIGEVLILRASLRRTVDPWAIGLTVIGSSGSIVLNVAGVGPDAGRMDYVVAAVPPVAALFAFGALMRQLHGALAARAVTAPVALPQAPVAPPQSVPAPALEPAPVASTEAPSTPPSERPAEPDESAPEALPPAAPERLGVTPQSARKPAPKADAKAPRKPLPKRPRSASRADAKAALEALYETHMRRPLEGEMVGALKALSGYPHTSRQHANSIRKEIERERPDLAALGSDNVRALTGS